MHEAINYQIGMKLFQEGYHQLGGIHCTALHSDESHRNQNAGQDLQPKFGTGSEAQISPMNNLHVIVGEADSCEGARRSYCNPDKAVGQVGPEERWDNNGDHDQHATHRGSSSFFLVCFGPFLANVLSDLKISQAINYQWADYQAGKERSKTGEGGAKREIAKNSEGRKIMEEL